MRRLFLFPIVNHVRRIPPIRPRIPHPATLGKPAGFPCRRYQRPAQVLLSVDVPLSVRQVAYGACAQLHDWRCAGALSPHAGLQRAATHGLGRLWLARRKCRHGQSGGTRRVDVFQHCLHEAATEVAGAGYRLVAGSDHLPPGILPLGAMAVYPFVPEGADLQAFIDCELGSGRSNRVGQ